MKEFIYYSPKLNKFYIATNLKLTHIILVNIKNNIFNYSRYNFIGKI